MTPKVNSVVEKGIMGEGFSEKILELDAEGHLGWEEEDELSLLGTGSMYNKNSSGIQCQGPPSRKEGCSGTSQGLWF